MKSTHLNVCASMREAFMKTVTLLVGTASLVLAGCAQLKPDPDHWSESSEQVSRVDKHSSFPAVRRTNFEAVNLIELVDPRGLAKGGLTKLLGISQKNMKASASGVFNMTSSLPHFVSRTIQQMSNVSIAIACKTASLACPPHVATCSRHFSGGSRPT